MNEPVEKLINLMGGQTALATALTEEMKLITPIQQAHVWKWLNTTVDGIPAENVIPACKVCEWKMSPHELRPDLYPHPLDGLPESLRKRKAA